MRVLQRPWDVSRSSVRELLEFGALKRQQDLVSDLKLAVNLSRSRAAEIDFELSFVIAEAKILFAKNESKRGVALGIWPQQRRDSLHERGLRGSGIGGDGGERESFRRPFGLVRFVWSRRLSFGGRGGHGHGEFVSVRFGVVGCLDW